MSIKLSSKGNRLNKHGEFGFYLVAGTILLYGVYNLAAEDEAENSINFIPIEGVLDLNFSPTNVPTPTELPHASLWKNEHVVVPELVKVRSPRPETTKRVINTIQSTTTPITTSRTPETKITPEITKVFAEPWTTKPTTTTPFPTAPHIPGNPLQNMPKFKCDKKMRNPTKTIKTCRKPRSLKTPPTFPNPIRQMGPRLRQPESLEQHFQRTRNPKTTTRSRFRDKNVLVGSRPRNHSSKLKNVQHKNPRNLSLHLVHL